MFLVNFRECLFNGFWFQGMGIKVFQNVWFRDMSFRITNDNQKVKVLQNPSILVGLGEFCARLFLSLSFLFKYVKRIKFLCQILYQLIKTNNLFNNHRFDLFLFSSNLQLLPYLFTTKNTLSFTFVINFYYHLYVVHKLTYFYRLKRRTLTETKCNANVSPRMEEVTMGSSPKYLCISWKSSTLTNYETLLFMR